MLRILVLVPAAAFSNLQTPPIPRYAVYAVKPSTLERYLDTTYSNSRFAVESRQRQKVAEECSTTQME